MSNASSVKFNYVVGGTPTRSSSQFNNSSFHHVEQQVKTNISTKAHDSNSPMVGSRLKRSRFFGQPSKEAEDLCLPVIIQNKPMQETSSFRESAVMTGSSTTKDRSVLDSPVRSKFIMGRKKLVTACKSRVSDKSLGASSSGFSNVGKSLIRHQIPDCADEGIESLRASSKSSDSGSSSSFMSRDTSQLSIGGPEKQKAGLSRF